MIDDIRSKLNKINQKNGFLFDVPDVVESESVAGLRSRGVALCRENGSVELMLNAKTRTLEQLKGYIKEVLDADFVLTEASEASIIATPKKIEGDDDAAT